MHRRALRYLALTALLALAACGETPQQTEQARGIAEGANIVVVLSVVFVLVAGGIIAAAIAYDRYVSGRRALEEAEAEGAEGLEEPEEEEETEVAGIGMGTGGVPRWLYAAYVIIPVFALVYVFTNVQVAEPRPEETEAPATEEPADGEGGLEITAENIEFDKDELTAPPTTEITLAFHNDDAGVPHNVAVYQTDGLETEFFIGETFDGVATEEYTFETPEAGEYYFRCDVHPNMEGTFLVEGG